MPGDIATSVPECWYGYLLARSYGSITWCAAQTESKPSRSAASATGSTISLPWSRPTFGSETPMRTAQPYPQPRRPAQHPPRVQPQQRAGRWLVRVLRVLRRRARRAPSVRLRAPEQLDATRAPGPRPGGSSRPRSDRPSARRAGCRAGSAPVRGSRPDRASACGRPRSRATRPRTAKVTGRTRGLSGFVDAARGAAHACRPGRLLRSPSAPQIGALIDV